MIDAYGRKIDYLRLSVTDLCNLRCRYCMPEDGICKKCHADMLTEEEMVMAVKAAASLGISKVRITGGEPLVKKNVISICQKIAAVDGIRKVCMTTNGTLLPEMAASLKAAGVSHINISLDTLNPQKYRQITRRDMHREAWNGLHAALEAGFACVKINVVLIGGFNDDEITDFILLTKKLPVDVRFIELMPMYDGGEFGAEAFISCDRVLEKMPDAEKIEAADGVARLYRLRGAKGHVGLISPISDHFCGQCSRIRLTADGVLKPCLHSAQEIPIKGLSQELMIQRMQEAVLAKPACHPVLSSKQRSSAGRNMNQIGG